jgi:hypothetical protein
MRQGLRRRVIRSVFIEHSMRLVVSAEAPVRVTRTSRPRDVWTPAHGARRTRSMGSRCGSAPRRAQGNAGRVSAGRAVRGFAPTVDARMKAASGYRRRPNSARMSLTKRAPRLRSGCARHRWSAKLPPVRIEIRFPLTVRCRRCRKLPGRAGVTLRSNAQNANAPLGSGDGCRARRFARLSGGVSGPPVPATVATDPLTASGGSFRPARCAAPLVSTPPATETASSYA